MQTSALNQSGHRFSNDTYLCGLAKRHRSDDGACLGNVFGFGNVWARWNVEGLMELTDVTMLERQSCQIEGECGVLAQLGRNDVSYLVKIGGVNAKEYGR